MSKSFLHTLFGFGRLPADVRASMEREGLLELDEGVPGWYRTPHLDAPGKRFRHRAERFAGAIAVSRTRVVLYTFGKRQINVPVDDPQIGQLHVSLPDVDTLSVWFESGVFQPGSSGIIEFRLTTARASPLFHALLQAGLTERSLPIYA